MTELSTLARPYAEAVFKRAKESDSTKEWYEQLQFLSIVVQEPGLSAIVDSPRVSKQKIIELLFDVCQEHISNEGGNLLKLLVENRKQKLLPAILNLYQELRAADEGYVNVELYTAYPLTKTEQTKYSTMLEKQLGKKVHAAVSVDKSLIGGILAKAGDKVIDGSVKGRIHQLAKRL